MHTSLGLCTLVRGAFGVGGRGHLTSEVPEEDFQLLGLTGAPPVEVSSWLCLGTVIRLQDLKEAGHVGPDLLHQAVSDCADSVPITLQEAAHESVVVSVVGKIKQDTSSLRTGETRLAWGPSQCHLEWPDPVDPNSR